MLIYGSRAEDVVVEEEYEGYDDNNVDNEVSLWR
jgi:hypothetical protein